jgi:hypothetical protein
MNGVIVAFVPPTPRPIKTMLITSPARPDSYWKIDGREVTNCAMIAQRYRLTNVSMGSSNSLSANMPQADAKNRVSPQP